MAQKNPSAPKITPELKSRATKIVSILEKTYPRAKIVLWYKNNFELLVSVILSAQCTDKQVNKVTEKLFKKYHTVKDYATANQKEFEQDIRSTGFYRNKTKNVIGAAKMIIEKFGGKVPNTMEELLQLPGVARKTANIVLGNAFGIVEGIAVDTHMRRVNFRLGLTKQTTPEKIEQDLMALLPKEKWFNYTYYVIEHGRAICDAKKPLCKECQFNKLCPKNGVDPKFYK
ncbi:TPA: endonuclease III [archaeon]|uniref:Endonuclease III n=1 Tax=Candidatus Naiadarchaeum limnaeum TaxID=2756139 RepID=A0A832V632_9ARCH|nr:endonuclease III [Candidatus Naiadarchaeum limnaeum]